MQNTVDIKDVRSLSRRDSRAKRLFALAVLAILLCGCQSNHIESSDALREFDNRIGRYYNYNTVDWRMLDTLYYRPYMGDWPEEYGAVRDSSHFLDAITSVDVQYWHLLQNARMKFHQDNLHLRRGGNAQVISALDEVEAAFDSVFVLYLRGSYYSRACMDSYEEVMPEAIDKLVTTIK